MIAERRSIGPESIPSLTHYYGDVVRVIILTIVALLLLSAPFYADDLKAELPFEVAGAVVLAGLAALTNPRSGAVIIVDDVYTTGSTMNEIAKTLKRAGAERVEVLTVARVANDIYRAEDTGTASAVSITQ